MNLERALEVARQVVAARYPGARCAWLAGSIVRGAATPTSDLDIVVLRDAGAVLRETVEAGGCPVELFVHTAASLARFQEADCARGRPSLVQMVAEGVPLLGEAEARVWGGAARERLAAGPAPDPTRLEDLRYRVTDLWDDLRGADDPDELLAIGLLLAPALADLHFATQGRWSGGGKWLPRRLAEEGGPAVLDAVRALSEGAAGPLSAIAETVLRAAGGPLRAGYRRVVPGSDQAQQG